MELATAVSLITGGRSGLGAAAARRLADAGGDVVILDLVTEDADTAPSRLNDHTNLVPCDVTDPDAVAAAMLWILDQFGRLDVCVNAAGIPDSARMIAGDGTLFPLDTFKRVVAVNLIGTFDVMRHAARLMAANDPGADDERGVIVNVSSGAALQGQIGQAAYSASKAGVLGLTLPAARDLARHGIRVVAVSPGVFLTGMARSLPPAVVDSLRAQALYPKRLGDPDEFAELILHIIENRYINAANLPIDAGLRLV